jgi:hypothetical protein
MFSIQKVDHFPEITRQGRVSEELQAIINALEDSAAKGERFCIGGIESGNAYNSMQQRIRAQAKKSNLKVVIRFDKDENNLYFKASRASGQDKVAVTETMTDAVSDDLGISASEAGAKPAVKRAVKNS